MKPVAMKLSEKQAAIAIQLLQEIRSQDALTDRAWDSKEVRRWIRRCDKLIGPPPLQEGVAE